MRGSAGSTSVSFDEWLEVPILRPSTASLAREELRGHHGASTAESRRLNVSALSLGNWVTFANANQLETLHQASACLAATREVGVNFFESAESCSSGGSERRGRRLSPAGLGAPRLRRLVQGDLEHPRRSKQSPHPQPRVPAPGHRPLPLTPWSGPRRPGVMSPARPQHADRRDGVSHERDGRIRPGPLPGHLVVERRRDPRRPGHRRPPPPARAGGRPAPIHPPLDLAASSGS